MLENFLIYFLQTAQTATTPAIATSAPVDINTLLAALVPLGGLAYAVMKVLKDKMKKSESTSLKNTANMIETFVLPALQSNSKFVEKTQVQDVKIEQLASALYDFMGKNANAIHDKPEIRQKNLIADAAVSKKEQEDYATKVKQVEDLKIKLGLVPAPPVTIVQQQAPKAEPVVAAEPPSMVWDEATSSWISK
jgi:hypothetical protein